jgi:gamma-glutamyltranspeptidase / glutathione hydrolase
MDDFSTPGKRDGFGYFPCPSNYIAPRKRPMSSITPAIVEHASNNSLYLVVGAAGGSRILTTTLQQLWHVLDHNMTAKEALDERRLHDQLMPNKVEFEYEYDKATVAFMKDRGHNVTWVDPFGRSAAQSVRKLGDGSFEAASEPRQKNSGWCVV